MTTVLSRAITDDRISAPPDGETDIAIVGAGPYGLSLAAHLRGRGVAFRIFGTPMETWQTRMPKGMSLKSEGFASSLYDPAGSYTLAHFCRERGIPYADIGLPVALDTFTAYGLAFQQRFVPTLEERNLTRLTRDGRGFRLEFADGGTVRARQVVIAAGIGHFAYTPEPLAGLPAERVSHSSQHYALDEFAGREVIVVGAGASAVDVAVSLCDAGALVQLAARTERLKFHEPPKLGARSIFQRLRYPRSGLGSGWKARLVTDFPDFFRRLPVRTRVEFVRTFLGPAPCWFTQERFSGAVQTHLGATLERADVRGDRIELTVRDARGHARTLSGDHVIAATGYRVDLARFAFLDDRTRGAIRLTGTAPTLSRNFESSIPGLYFVGATAANTFGPLLRFAYGAGFAAQRVSKRLIAKAAPVRR
jgi:thioredoxin reductase